MPRRFVTVDVFTDRPFGGNPLAVVPDARGLDEAEMQTLAREFNYSETTFVLPPTDPANTARVRIFTPAAELPFAGHPNVGTAFVLALEGSAFGAPVGGEVRFEEAAGLVPVDVLTGNHGRVVGARLTAPQALAVGAEIPVDRAATAVGLAEGDIATAVHPPTIASAGLDFPLIELASADALARARPDGAAMAAMGGHAFVYVRDGEVREEIRGRMFAPGMGITEDPATGSAVAALGGFLGERDGTDGLRRYRVTQGVEMGRPSLLDAEVVVEDGRARKIHVGGQCVTMMRGELPGEAAIRP